jgi:fused signal recognition particle receptor
MFDFFKKNKTEEQDTTEEEQVVKEIQDGGNEIIKEANQQEELKADTEDVSLGENKVEGGILDVNQPDITDEESKENESLEEEPQEKEKGFFSRLKAGLAKTRNSLNESFDNLFKGFTSIDDDFYDELEETLIMADLGLDTTERIIDNLKELVKKNHIKEVEACRELVINIIKEQMLVEDSAYDFEDQKTVMLIIGVNGVGKTTSIGKLAAQYKNRGKRVMMCAADTFRAAAIDQLKTWANRAGVEIIAQHEGSDPAAVTFDAVKAAASRDVDILLVDTAGRLHNKKNLMDELAKMKRIIEREYSDAHLETLIVLDGSTGQNALEQARQFSTVTNIDGIILTKLDGTAKGGIAIAIQSELNVPVKYIGVGEQINDLQKFNPESYVNALFADMDTRSDIEILIPEEDS